MEKRYFAMQMQSCEDKLKGKTAHFRLPSASQKRACLSSPIRVQTTLNHIRFVNQMLRKKVKLLLEQPQVCIFVEIVLVHFTERNYDGATAN